MKLANPVVPNLLEVGWQHLFIKLKLIFGMAAILFLCNGILINQFNLPKVKLGFILKLTNHTFFVPASNVLGV